MEHDRLRVGAGSFFVFAFLFTAAPNFSQFQRSALVGVKDACELGRALRLALGAGEQPSNAHGDSMRGLFDKIARAFGSIDAVEFAFPAIFAALLLFIGPPLASLYFWQTQHYIAAGVGGGLWILAAVCGVRDFRRRHFGWVSFTFCIVWLITTLILWWRLQTL